MRHCLSTNAQDLPERGLPDDQGVGSPTLGSGAYLPPEESQTRHDVLGQLGNGEPPARVLIQVHCLSEIIQPT